MEIIYQDADIVVAIKPPRVLSTDEPGGMPELLRQELGTTDIRTVHRLDRVVSGLMVLAMNAESASNLSEQIRLGRFEKEYLAVIHGSPERKSGELRDLLLRDKRERKTYVVQTPAKGVQEAILRYRTVDEVDGLTKVEIELITGRTHQIRAQFSSRDLPLVGDRKYSHNEDDCEIALWSCRLAFDHPVTGERMIFTQQPPEEYPWNVF
jgi:23S rRNA pseudouridine1911/1915/1917 synthase